MANYIFMRNKGEAWKNTGITRDSLLEIIQREGARTKEGRMATLIVDKIVNGRTPDCLTPDDEIEFEVREVSDNTETTK